MKLMTIFMVFAFTLTGSVFANPGETTTDCPMMREMNERNNPKANLGTIKSKGKKQASVTKQ